MNNIVTATSIVIITLLGFRGFFELMGFSGSTNLMAFSLSLSLAFLALFKGRFMFPVPFAILFFISTSYISSLINGTTILQFLSYNKTVIGFFYLFHNCIIKLY